MRDTGREFIVGIVFFALLGALGVITIYLGKDTFKKKEEVTFKFDDVAGLAVGSDVWINGLPSGLVKDIAIAPDGTVEATASMRTHLEGLDLGGGATVAVKSKSALGGAIVSLETKKGGEKKTLQDLVGTTWKSKKDAFEAVGDRIGEVTGEMKELIKDTREGSGLLGALVRDDTLAANVKATVENLRRISDEIANGRGTLGRLVKDDSLYTRAEAAIAALEEFTKNATSGKGLIGKLMNDEVLAQRVDRVMKNLDEMVENARAGKGTVGKLLQDEALYDDLKGVAADLKDFTKQVKEGDGLLHQLAYDKQTGDDFRTTMKDLRATFGDIREGKGTVGKLMADDALYQDLRGAVRSLQRSFEEARENAPILTFAGFLFKTF